MNRRFLLTFLLALFSTVVWAEQDSYRIDNTHSFANWTIRHVVSKTSGTFSDVTGKILINTGNLADSSVNASINMLSLNSNHAKRDEHLKKEEYLDFAKSTEMTFVSSKIEANSNTEGLMTGILTLHGVSKELSFPFKVLGFGYDPWGGYRMGIEAHTSIKASDFGFKWPLKPNPPVGDDVEITLLIEGIKQPREILK
jgi:polyisoprenoid-binding protein YceI